MVFNRGFMKKMKRAVPVAIAAALMFGSVVHAETMSLQADATAYLDGQRESVTAAQNRLISLGMLKGSADGAYGPKTAAALSEFQGQNGLEPTGHLDAGTLNLLTNVTADTATAVDIQQKLIDLGYLQGSADGIIGPRSLNALKLFQQLHGLRTSGAADGETLSSLFSDEAIALPATIGSGSDGEDVKRLQRRLILYGFMEGEADGSYGQNTASAVRAFQKHLTEQGYEDYVSVDGVAGAMTQYCLYSDSYSTFLKKLHTGDTDGEVQRLERRLAKLGYLDAEADDTLDDYAIEAMTLFRDDAGLSTSDIDQELVDALFSERAPMADHCAPHDIASGDSGLAVAAVEQALVDGGLMTRQPSGSYNESMEDAVEKLHKYLTALDDDNAALYADAKALTVEAQQRLEDGLLGYRTDSTRNETEVMRIQNRLHTLYYLPKSGIDGKFGRNSRNAISEFQAANGLVETGEPDEATQSVLFSSRAIAKPYPYRIEVCIDRQVVEVYRLVTPGEYELAQSFTCSTGLHNSTPRGVYFEGHPVNRWHYFEKFNCWAQYSYSITGDIMFHSVIYSSNSEKSVRSGSVYALGSPASHGCVRLKVEDAKWLFENCKRNTSVIVIY